MGNGKGWGYECLVGIQKNAILVKETYDPKGWNKYPEVTPPEKIWMRCEGHDHDTGMLCRAALVFDGETWRDVRRDSYWLGTVERFRPWDEEKES